MSKTQTSLKTAGAGIVKESKASQRGGRGDLENGRTQLMDPSQESLATHPTSQPLLGRPVARSVPVARITG